MCIHVCVVWVYCLASIGVDDYLHLTQKRNNVFCCLAGPWGVCHLFENHSGKTGECSGLLMEH